MSDDGHHLAGDLLGTTAAAIGGALKELPHTRLEISSEVAFEGDAFDIAIYPTRTAPGGEDFLVGGNIWLPVEQARALVAAIAASLAHGGVQYQLELAIEQDVSRTEVSTHPGYPQTLAARTRS